MAAHSHPHEQLVWIIKGKMEFRIDKERQMLEAGGVAVFPGGVKHEGWCHEDAEVVDIFVRIIWPAVGRHGCTKKAAGQEII